MCGFVGFINFKENISDKKEIIENMNTKLIYRGPDENGYYINDILAFGHRRLIVVDPKKGKQPMIEKYHYNEYILIFNGQIYNTDELKKILLNSGFTFEGHSDRGVT